MNLATIKSKEFMPGCHGKMIHGQKLSWAFWNIEKGSIIPEHQHHHEQIMHVVNGKFEFTLIGNTQVHTSGDIVHINSNSPHSGRALTSCEIMDVFSPVRNEYR